MEYNGGCVIAMMGKDCAAIGTDLRFGVQGMTVATNYEKVFEIGPQLYVGLPGLATDTETVVQRLKLRVNLYELKEGRKMQPAVLTKMIANMLYERRFGPYFVEPVIAGWDTKKQKPFVGSMDVIGCITETDEFALAGTCNEQLYGMSEALWQPDMTPDELFECISQTMMNAFDRDAVSGMGAIIHIIEKGKVTTRKIKTRMD